MHQTDEELRMDTSQHQESGPERAADEPVSAPTGADVASG